MTVSPAELAARPGPRYRALADSLECAIREKRLKPGDRLPPQRDLAFDLDVTTGTVGRAYSLLLQRGLVRGEVGRGTFVLEPGMLEPGVRQTIPAPLAAPTWQHDLAVNRPVAVAAQGEVFRLLGELSTEAGALGQLLTYPPYPGHIAHRQALARWLSSFAGPVDAACVLPCQGTQNGMAAALSAVTRPGDTILMEALSYPSNQGLAGRLGLKIEPVAMDDEGAMPESIIAEARRYRPAAIVLSPDLQNPTLATASAGRREAIVRAARAHDLTIIEDAVYAPVAGSGLPSLRELAPDATLLVTSISKFLAPGLRLGCVVAPSARMPQLIGAQAHFAVGAPPLIVERRRAALAVLDGLTVTSRTNALHVLLQLPPGLDLAGTVLRLSGQGIHTTPLSVFAVGRAAVPATLRLSLGAEPDVPSLERCLAELRRVLEQGAATQPVI